MVITAPNGFCNIPKSNVFIHHAKPVHYAQSPVKIGNALKYSNQRRTFLQSFDKKPIAYKHKSHNYMYKNNNHVAYRGNHFGNRHSLYYRNNFR